MIDIHILPKNEPGVCILHAGLTVVEPEAEKKIEDLELEAKKILPQVRYASIYSLYRHLST